MFDFLAGIGDLLLGVVDFIVGLFEDIAFIVELASNTIATIPSYFSWLPAPLLGIVVTGCTVLLIYKIAGR